MKVEVEQFSLPFVWAVQVEFPFVNSRLFCPLWAFAWWAVLRIESLPRRPRRFRIAYRAALPAIVAQVKRSGFCIEGVLSFR